MVFMCEGKRGRLSLTQRTDIWSRWKAGQSLHEIGRAFGKPHSCIRRLLLPRGAIPPAARYPSRVALGFLPSVTRRLLVTELHRKKQNNKKIIPNRYS
jgi:Helix-turn-helix domain